MDVDDAIEMSDPAVGLSAGSRAAVTALVAETEAFVRKRRRGRLFALTGGAAGVVLAGAGVANAVGFHLTGGGRVAPPPACSVTMTVRTDSGLRQLELAVLRDTKAITELQARTVRQALGDAVRRADRTKSGGEFTVAPRPDQRMQDLVLRLAVEQGKLNAMETPQRELVCPQK